MTKMGYSEPRSTAMMTAGEWSCEKKKRKKKRKRLSATRFLAN